MSIEYATCRWNHCDSSNGMNLIFGLMYRSSVLHMGSKMRVASKLKFKPAPLDSQTEKVRVLSPASRIFVSWKNLNWTC